MGLGLAISIYTDNNGNTVNQSGLFLGSKHIKKPIHILLSRGQFPEEYTGAFILLLFELNELIYDIFINITVKTLVPIIMYKLFPRWVFRLLVL